MTAETAGINLALPGYRFEDLQCLSTLLGGYRHPDGCEHHVFTPFEDEDSAMFVVCVFKT
jgi:hypothetical protein